MRKFSANSIYTLDGKPIADGIVITDDNGKILAITEQQLDTEPDVEYFDGVIVPGFVNSHCHLELSHLHRKIDKGTGLISFLKDVIRNREEDEEIILEAMKKADDQMYKNGIVAVGDISNNGISAEIKESSNINYHTFIEMIGFDGSKSDDIFEAALKLHEQFLTSASITLHAPYSFSKELLKHLTKYCEKGFNPISIHNQENDEENALYRYKVGEFIPFFKEMNINSDGFKAQSKNSLQTIYPFLTDHQPIQLVHNTYTSLKDIYFTKRFAKDINWCFCPNANQYIESKLPSFEFFKHSKDPITIGTDSLASNSQLCLLSEMKVLQLNIEDITFEEILRWGTINGAKFLGLENDFGCIRKGKTPGLNLVSHVKNGKLTRQSTVKKLI